MIRGLAVTALFVLSACGVKTEPPAAAVATPSLDSKNAAPSPTPTATADPLRATFRDDPGAAAPGIDIWATSWSNLVRHWSAGKVTEIAFSCGDAIGVKAYAASALVYCSAGQTGDVYRVTDGGRTKVGAGSGLLAVSSDGRQLVLSRLGTCPGPAPVCDQRYVLVDVASTREQILLPDGYYLGASIGWTTLGLTYLQPECADAGCSGVGDKGGTFLWDGAKFKRESPLRFVASAGQFKVFERGRSSNRADATVVLSGPNGDLDLTPAGKNERALSVNAAGETLVAGTMAGSPALIRYDPSGHVLWWAAYQGEPPVAATDTIVVTGLYSAAGTPAFQIYDLARSLHFEARLGDARVWSVVGR